MWNELQVLVNAAYKEMLDKIVTVIHPNVQITGGTTQFFQRLHAVNSKISSYLDLNRENYTKLVDKMNGKQKIAHFSDHFEDIRKLRLTL